MRIFNVVVTSLLLCCSAIVQAKSDRAAPANASTHIQTLVLGSGCFWGAEKGYEALPGVIDAVSGYSDGKHIKPTYSDITRLRNRFNPDNYAEVVEVTYDSGVIDTRTLLQHYFEHHDPTQKNRQGNDVGTQYRSIILTTTDEQLATAKAVRDEFQGLLSKAGYGEIVTIMKPLDAFYPAEDYHQDYLAKNPNGYCPNHATGVVFHAGPAAPAADNSALLKGKHVVVLEADYCLYCESFKRDVAKDYKGEPDMVFRKATELDGLALTTPTWATPTIFFVEDGKEVAAHQGYLNAADFNAAVARFNAGKAAF